MLLKVFVVLHAVDDVDERAEEGLIFAVIE